ncbi:hypothetical protein BC834DRAFT_970691 [Gloeopeniophorella convolvens]|nr:hypothetical protein BC834DRAFT_970691 [Gloeopeniophorella convolvens]
MIFAEQFDKNATDDTLTHLKCELIHQILHLIQNGKFVDVYKEGLVLDCGDGTEMLMFLRLLIYVADYPEKALLATIKRNGMFMCPRCLVPKSRAIMMGTKKDQRERQCQKCVDDTTRRRQVKKARKLVFDGGRLVKSKAVQKELPGSKVPTLNAFSEKLQEFGFDFHKVILPDFLHEVELGVGPCIIEHLLRILVAAGGNGVQEFNERFRMIGTFGRDTIRRFTGNVSSLRKLAARDYEDIIQCAPMVFDGLLGEDVENQKIVDDLLFDLATVHSYSKMRMHTDTTSKNLRVALKEFSRNVRVFQAKTCAKYITNEMPHDQVARGRKKAAVNDPSRDATAPVKELNLATYKMHALGDYVETIQWIGGLEHSSTQNGELQHRISKRRFQRTNKNQFVKQIAQHEARERVTRRVATRIKSHLQERDGLPTEPSGIADGLPFMDPAAHYHMSKSTCKHFHLPTWLGKHQGDPALEGFNGLLKDHLLQRLLDADFDGDEHERSEEERGNIFIVNDRIFKHKVLRINYTSYDVRRQQDSINPRTHADIMVLSPEDITNRTNPKHPYWYARVLGIFHAVVQHRQADGTVSPPRAIDFLWVRWFGINNDCPGGWSRKRLHRLSFIPGDEPGAFGFLDPEQVIRAVHLIPVFALGRTSERLRELLVRRPEDKGEDWECYGLNMFADRDAMMRQHGGGVGHRSTRFLNRILLRDLHVPRLGGPAEVHGDATDDEGPGDDEEIAEHIWTKTCYITCGTARPQNLHMTHG